MLLRGNLAAKISVAALVLISVVQEPGRVTFDTKLDLSVDPIAFMGRALHLWNPEATSGELQNQAYGYLFPMGPFFALGQLAGVPAWLTQRLWCALLLCTAFLGVLLLSRALSLGNDASRCVAAFAYALAPRMLTEIGPLSSEMLPTVMLPWVLLPLVRYEHSGSVRRAAALSALAVFLMGGVNAAMVLMALVLPGIWLLTREWNPRHVRLVLAWCAAVLAATLWWILPLLQLGRYSPPFLDYIESADNTTAPVSLFQALRGTNQWVAYVLQGQGEGPWWPQGWVLVDNPVLMVATAVVAGVGLAGLTRRSLPHRRFLVPAMLAGLVLLTVGYAGTLDSPLSGAVRDLLDGPLAPLRNVHKFEPVLRLPIVLGFAHGAGFVWSARWHRLRAETAIAAVLIFVAAAPAWLLMLRPGPGWPEIPGYWRQAAGWLQDHQRDGRTLLLPASGFGEYTWGFTVDEPIQALGGVRWALRSQVPLGSPGNTRMMDTVSAALDTGRGSPALASFLSRSGYRYLLLRNDVTSLSPTVQRRSLERSPGIALVKTFGPLTVYEVQRAGPGVSVVDAASVPTVTGAPEGLLPLLEQGLLAPDQPAVLAPGGSIVTDTPRKAERNFGRVYDNLSQTMAADEAPRQTRTARDVLPPSPSGSPATETVAAYTGIRTVTASTAASFADAPDRSDPSRLPFAAVDGDPATAWHSASDRGSPGQWLEVDLDTPRVLNQVSLQLVDDVRVGWPVTRVRITTDAGSVETPVPPDGAPHTFPVAAGLTDTVRVTVTGVAGDRTDGNMGIRELSIPGMTAQRSLVVPDAGLTFSFSRGDQYRPACLPEVCNAALARTGEEPSGLDRMFTTPSQARFQVSATVLPRPGGVSPVRPPGLDVSASSQLGGDVAAGAQAAVDSDPGTAWIADIGDLRPVLRLSWTGPRTISEIELTPTRKPGVSAPVRLELRTPGGNRLVSIPDSGRATFKPVTTDRLELVVLDTAGTDTDAPPGIAELRVRGLPAPGPPSSTFSLPCGAGPTIELDGTSYPTAVSGSVADMATGFSVKPCGDLAAGITLGAGQHRLRTLPSAEFAVQDLALRSTDLSTVTHRPVSVRDWGAVSRKVHIGPGSQAYLVVPENANAGWQAFLDGRRLTSSQVDGWQQAWIVPAGQGGDVTLRFAPDRAYRIGIAFGALTALVVVLLAVLPGSSPVRASSSVYASTGPWMVTLLGVLLVLLGGWVPLAALLAALLVREFWGDGPLALVLGGAAVATAVAVGGQVAGHGQGWADGHLAQGALLVAVAAVVASCVDWFGAGGHARRRTLD